MRSAVGLDLGYFGHIGRTHMGVRMVPTFIQQIGRTIGRGNLMRFDAMLVGHAVCRTAGAAVFVAGVFVAGPLPAQSMAPSAGSESLPGAVVAGFGSAVALLDGEALVGRTEEFAVYSGPASSRNSTAGLPSGRIERTLSSKVRPRAARPAARVTTTLATRTGFG